MYQYTRRRPPRRGFGHYLRPFILILVLFGLLYAGFGKMQNWIQSGTDDLSGKVLLNINNGTVKAMTVGKADWQDAFDDIYLYRGEKIKTKVDGRATLTFLDKSIVRMDHSSELELSMLKNKEDRNNIELLLNEGQIWTQIEPITDPASHFTVYTPLLTIDSRGGTYAVNGPGTVYMIDGKADIEIKKDEETVKKITLGVGQQLNVNEDVITQLQDQEAPEIIFALSDIFKASDWYQWNQKRDGDIDAFETSEEPKVEEMTEEDASVETQDLASPEEADEEKNTENYSISNLVKITNPLNGISTNKSTIAIEGTMNSDNVNAVYVQGKKASMPETGKWKIYEMSLTREGKNTLTIEAEDKSGNKITLDPLIVNYDTTPPATPVITKPGMNNEEVEIDDVEQEITGSMSGDTQAVIVNDYRLGKYVPGSKEFSYFAKTTYDNLKVGKNEYLVYAEDKAGNQSEPAKITLILPQSIVDEAKGDVETRDLASPQEDEGVPAASSTGGVTITEPNNGASFTTSETRFDIKGTVPAGTTKVEVNDYRLQLFESGSTEFRYTASSSMGNLEIGKQNTYTVKAYNSDGEVLGTASITIDVESGSTGAPKFTIPTDTGSYTTNLDEVTIGGTAGKWITRVFINDQNLDTYIPGSEEWSKVVKLEAGENVFTLYGKQGTDQTASSSLTITYTP